MKIKEKINKEKIIIVTGGTGQLGRVIVKQLATAGHKIYVPSQSVDIFRHIFDNSQSGEKFSLSKIYSFQCDARKLESVREFVESVSALEKGRIDALINTIGGIHSPVFISDSDDFIFDNMIDLNLRSAFNFSKEIVRIMKNNSFGRIISISALASLKVTPGSYFYSMTKSAVNLLMNSISEEMKDYNIRCNTIIPGIIDTPSNREWGSADDINKWISPESIANIVRNLLSEEFDDVQSSEIKVLGKY